MQVQRIREGVKHAAARLGYDIRRRDLTHPARRAAAMRRRGIDLVLDVGANTGQYVGWLREFGYLGRIVSFEPLPQAFADLNHRWSSDPGWTGRQTALGAAPGTARLNVASSTVLSSLLEPTEELTSRIAQGRAVQQIEVPVAALDDVWDEFAHASRAPMLKIDTQGYEHTVLDGAQRHLSDLVMIEIEMALVELYEGGSTSHTVLPRPHSAGFEVISIDSGFVDAATGQVLDIDVLFGRSTSHGRILQ